MLADKLKIKLRKINGTRERIIFARYGMKLAESAEVRAVGKDDFCTSAGVERRVVRNRNVFCVVNSRKAENFLANALYS